MYKLLVNALYYLDLIENNRIFINETILTETLNSLDNRIISNVKMIYNEIIECHNIQFNKKILIFITKQVIFF